MSVDRMTDAALARRAGRKVAMHFYDRAGKSMTLGAWAKEMERPSARAVAFSKLRDGRHVSTIWLGMDHSLGGGPPLIFESIVFPACEITRRWPTEKAARKGHDMLVAECGGTLAAPSVTKS